MPPDAPADLTAAVAEPGGRIVEIEPPRSQYRGHAFIAADAAGMIDWDLAGKRPAGYDLMHY